MFCCTKRANKIEKRLRRNAVHPTTERNPINEGKVDNIFIDNFIKEAIHCGYCNKVYTLGSNELKIHCNICNQFFHCGIAGKCIGKDCKEIKDGIEHYASYCINCVAEIYGNNKCLCKDCKSTK